VGVSALIRVSLEKEAKTLKLFRPPEKEGGRKLLDFDGVPASYFEFRKLDLKNAVSEGSFSLRGIHLCGETYFSIEANIAPLKPIRAFSFLSPGFSFDLQSPIIKV